MSGQSIWERFVHDPRVERNARLRASDRDRDVVNDVLGAAYADGRLSPEELDQRTDQVSSIKTLGELPAVIDDLVLPEDSVPASVQVAGSHRAEAERRYRRLRLVTLLVFLLPTLICWVVWVSVLLGGAGTTFPWPIFPTLGTSVPLVLVLASRKDLIAGSEHRLERREIRRQPRALPRPQHPQIRRPTQPPPPPPDDQAGS
jgi:hypothetical protein